MKIFLILLSLFSTSLYAGAILTVECNHESDDLKTWQFANVQEARDFMRELCPKCVSNVSIKKVFIAGLDDLEDYQ